MITTTCLILPIPVPLAATVDVGPLVDEAPLGAVVLPPALDDPGEHATRPKANNESPAA
ncbi:MAG TPA: hypothetical protein VLL25_16435 [Acidimicrobiales bacterium]|nr:hypothetical protein [Acidimicrobiales bacterium]